MWECFCLVFVKNDLDKSIGLSNQERIWLVCFKDAQSHGAYMEEKLEKRSARSGRARKTRA